MRVWDDEYIKVLQIGISDTSGRNIRIFHLKTKYDAHSKKDKLDRKRNKARKTRNILAPKRVVERKKKSSKKK